MNDECQEIRQLFDRLLDGELSREEQSLVAEHTGKCPSCRDELQRDRDVIAMFDLLPELECPEHVLESIRDNVRSREKASVRPRGVIPIFRTLRRPLILAAAAAIIAFLFIRGPWSGTRHSGRIGPESVAYSPEDIRRARADAKWTLAFTARQVTRAEGEAARTALFEYFPRTVKKSIRSSLQEPPGGAV
jgi:anti-sigma factor RsiW